jgi:predicted RNA-binding protein with PIN domain
MTLVLVDANNVFRSVWPNMPEAELVDRCQTWAELAGQRVVIVFDRRAPGGFEGEEALDARCSVVGSGSVTADEWIVERVRELSAAGSPYVLVTSDRGLRATAGQDAERVIGGGAFARLLLDST